ncbi:helix-turn-helix domain-containing protein [Cytophagaceae bacterium 50C-KIRBA]|uniref:Helix-turn-helix domain-containing protein n=1 Tax=Aquirufa beregesia TaxID=2516556 RepID=A0ABX0EVB5_9BACT|nr:helix-turn-helix domain-containing protein [Aquirufa beregesia]NGZ43512.1 helix-turn-helix domain-containing protein [Aquirufa beregesia]
MEKITINYYLYFLGFLFFAFGASLMLKKGLLATRLLGLQFLQLGIQLYCSYYIQLPLIVDHPHFFRVISPLFYVIGPLSFLFQHFLLYPERKFKPIYFLHFLPFAFHFLEFVPLYLSTEAVKIAEINEVIKQSTFNTNHSSFGLFSMRTHVYLKGLSYISYMIWTAYELFKYYQSVSKSFLLKNRLIVFWLTGDLVLKIIVLACHITFNIIYQDQVQAVARDFLYAGEFALMALFLFLNPRLLDGPYLKGLVFQHSHREIQEKIEDLRVFDTDKSRINVKNKSILEKMDRYFESEFIFLKPNISLNLVAQSLKIKPRLIRISLQEELDFSFTDYVNSWRIQYAEEQCRDNSRWKSFKIEVIATESGFGTRQSFNTAVKKLKGVSPGQYFAKYMN